MPGDVAGRFAATGGVTDVDGVPEVEMLDHRRDVGGVVIHVMTLAHLRRAAVAAPVVSDDAIAHLQEVEHLCVPIVAAKGPSMVEDDRLGSGPQSLK